MEFWCVLGFLNDLCFFISNCVPNTSWYLEMIFEKTRVTYANVFVNQLASVKFGIRKILNAIYIFRKFWIIGVENAKLQIFKGFLKPPETKKKHSN
jgi:hypothetical protein